MKKLITRCFTISKNPWKLLPIYFNDILLSNIKDKIKTILFCAKKVWEGRGVGGGAGGRWIIGGSQTEVSSINKWGSLN